MNDAKNNSRLGYRKPEGTRKQRQLRAYDDEWEIINSFARIVKHGDKQSAVDFINSHSIAIESQ